MDATQNLVTTRPSWQGRLLERFFRLIDLPKLVVRVSRNRAKAAGDLRTPRRRHYAPVQLAGVTGYWIGDPQTANGVLVYLPGGGFVLGPQRLHWKHCERLSQTLGYAVLVIPYRLAPEHPFPEALNGIVDSLTRLQQTGVLPNNWLLGGDSAGGNLSLTVTYRLHQLGAPLPRKLLLLSPVVDLSNADGSQPSGPADPLLSAEYGQLVYDAYVAAADVKDPLISPLYGDVSILPPTLLQIGTHDHLVYNVRKLVQKMRAAGRPIQFEQYAGLFHVFMLIRWLPEAKLAFRSQIAFITKP